MGWIIYAVLGLLILFAIIVLVVFRRKKNFPTDYHSLFVIGIIWLCAGIPLGVSANNWGLLGIGLVLMIIGLSHKKEWKKNIADRKKKWKNMGRKEKKILLWVKWILFLVLIAGIVVFLLYSGLL